MRPIGILLGSLAGALVASSSLLSVEASGVNAAAAAGTCTAVWVRVPDPPGKTRTRRPLTFSATDVLDLELMVIVPSARAGSPVEVKVYTPKGHLYQTLGVGNGEKNHTQRWRYDLLTARLPVAGTTIVNNSLYGTWKAEAYFQGAASPCAKARTFKIQP